MDRLETNIKLDDNKAVGLLVIGKTGVGKTTLINAFVNHFYKTNYEDPRHVLIPQIQEQTCTFPLYQNHYSPREMDKICRKKGESLTDSVVSYELKDAERTLIIVDTPGFGDTRGFEKDKENVLLIIENVKKYNFIQAILLVVDLSTREDPYFLYFMEEIKKIMTKSCAEQCIIVCTKTLELTFDSELKTILYRKLGLSPKNDDKFFVMDNNHLYKIPKSKSDQEIDKEIWQRSRETFEQIYKQASELPKILTQEMASLYEKRQKLEIEIFGLILIGQINDYKSLCERKMTKEQCEAFLKDPEKFVGEEKSKERHRIHSQNTNYNCDECNQTCISNTSRAGYIMGVIATLSIYHWISESKKCSHCGHLNSKHQYEKHFRFVGILPHDIQLLKERAEKTLQKANGEQITDAFISACKSVIEEKLTMVATLAIEIEKLGIADVGCDAYLSYLQEAVYFLNKDESIDPKAKDQKMMALEADKAQYLQMKEILKNGHRF